MSSYIRKSILAIGLLCMGMNVQSQSHSNRVSIGMGALYERGFDATISVEHETLNHNAWEYFLNGYVKYSKDSCVGHITHDSFWNDYNTWGLGVAYKPCVNRGKNNYGSLRIGGSAGSDRHEVMGWVNLGYEHAYALRGGWHLFWQVKTDVCINGRDLFRTGVVLGFKLPVSKR